MTFAFEPRKATSHAKAHHRAGSPMILCAGEQATVLNMGVFAKVPYAESRVCTQGCKDAETAERWPLQPRSSRHGRHVLRAPETAPTASGPNDAFLASGWQGPAATAEKQVG